MLRTGAGSGIPWIPMSSMPFSAARAVGGADGGLLRF